MRMKDQVIETLVTYMQSDAIKNSMVKIPYHDREPHEQAAYDALAEELKSRIGASAFDRFFKECVYEEDEDE